MSRPSDWYVVDLGGDPTPGEAWGVRSLAREYGEIAASARSESTVLTRVQSSGSSAVWVGEAAEVFREKLEDFPENIGKCAASFEIVRDAMYSWATSVESWQSQADTNLNKARLARADVEAAQAVLEAAQAAAASVQGDLDRALRTYNQYQFVEPPASVKVPSAYQISQLRYRATGASSSTTSASGTVQEAQDRFDAARALVLAAAEEFTSAAKTVVGLIEAAKDAGVEADSWWEKIYHSDAWQVMVTIVTVVVIVAAIAAFFVTGPLALVIAAVAIVGNVILNAQDIMAFAAGDMSAAEFFITMAMAFLPGGRAMKSLSNATDAATVAARSVDDVADTAVSTVARRADDGGGVAINSAQRSREVEALPTVTPAEYDSFLESLPTRGANYGSPAARAYQRRVTGSDVEYQLATPDGKTIWADGLRRDPEGRVAVMDAKFVQRPGGSAIHEGTAPRFIADDALDAFDREVVRYASVINDPGNPISRLEIITPTEKAHAFLSARMETIASSLKDSDGMSLNYIVLHVP